jgi:cellulose synthase/poly-beta-1,6-N-acetylglucosamine synthase-like glycosyltransferase
MEGLLIIFVAGTVALWLSVFGYVLLLRLLARRRRQWAPTRAHLPEVAVLVPVLDEENLILPKLADLRRTDYPAEKLFIVVADGGSRDRTADLVQGEIDAGRPIHLLRLSRAGGKSAQVQRALGALSQDLVVVTDVDAVLDPSCVPELVTCLLRDPDTAVAGAAVRPASPLLEERVYWWLLNHLWWLEGEALSASLVAGPCYAVRRKLLSGLRLDGDADDVQVALAAGACGLGVRLCRAALATEVRVPRTAAEVLRFRRKRGSDYVQQLRHSPPIGAPFGWRLVRWIRLWHFLVTPKIGLALALGGAALLASAHWPWALAALVAFAGPLLLAVARGAEVESDCTAWQAGLAALRLIGLTWFALLTLARPAQARQ